MKAFWWFNERSVAGMARPGFNGTRWFDLPFDESLLMGWLGQFTSGAQDIASFKNHIQSYAPRIFKFHGVKEESISSELQIFDSASGLEDVGRRLIKHAPILTTFHADDRQIHFTLSQERLLQEIDFLKSQQIDTIVALTEKHHNKDLIDQHFTTHHFSIPDLTPPQLDQAIELAEIIKATQRDQKRLAVHCLAGIGRTSTMIISAHLILGKPIAELKAQIARQNPSFALTGVQSDFIAQVAQRFQNPTTY